MGPLAMLGISAGAGIANRLFNKGQFIDTPENRAYLEYIKGELAKPESQLGYSADEKAAMLQEIEEALAAKAGQSVTSMSRRGLLSAGQAGAMAVDIGNKYGAAATDIELSSAEQARRQKQFLVSQFGMASGRQQYQPPQDINFGGLGESLGMLSEINNADLNPDKSGFTSGDFMQGLPNPGTIGALRNKRFNPMTGKWE